MTPIITIGGFLGSGKTTLVNNLLRQTLGKRLVVFVNDFGEINIDHSLIDTREEDRISLKNGCVCCTLNDDLVRKVTEHARAEIPADGIVIEASGVANPQAFNSSFDALEAAGLARLEARLYVIDVDGFSSLPYEISEQIIDFTAASDLTLLNKTDLASQAQTDTLTATLKIAAPYSRVIPTEHCAMDPRIIFNLESALPNAGSGNATNGSMHNVNWFDKWHCETTSVMDREKFEKFAKTLPEHCLRAKGLLRFSDTPNEIYLFNLVGYRASLERCVGDWSTQETQFIAIGQRGGMEKEQMQKNFQEILV